MKTKAVRLYGKNDLRLEEFDLPALKDDEILAEITSDSLCMSSYKATSLGADHKRVPNDVHLHPVIIGHEFAGTLVEVGKKWKNKFKEGSKFAIQPALNYKGSLEAPGYSYHHIGGDATHVIIPQEVMEMNCLLAYDGPGYFPASLSEPYSCVAGTFHAHYHTVYGSYVHHMGIKEGGNMAILAGAGPMGMAAIDYILHCDRKPGFLVVSDINQDRLDWVEKVLPVKEAEKNGIQLVYLNAQKVDDPVKYMRGLTKDKGFDDVLVFAPVKPLVEQGDALLAFDGCLNFFAGPSDQNFKAEFNFYNAHYAFTHITATSGGNTSDMIESLEMMSKGLLKPEILVTHIGGLNAVADTTINLPKLPGAKKLMYTQLDLPLIGIHEFAEKGKSDPLFKELAGMVAKNNGLWSVEAEAYLLKNAPRI